MLANWFRHCATWVAFTAAVLLVEAVIPQHNREFIGKWMDLEMLLDAAARERTAADRDLLEHARIPDDAHSGHRLTVQARGGQAGVATD